MALYDIKDTETPQLNPHEIIEKKVKEFKVVKRYTSHVNNVEASIDVTSSSFADGANPYYDDYIKKKKSNSINMCEDTRLEDSDIIKDLLDICTDAKIKVKRIDSSFYINLEKFCKHDKIVIKGNNSKDYGTITYVDTHEFGLKHKDGKRHKIQYDDIKNEKIIVLKNNK